MESAEIEIFLNFQKIIKKLQSQLIQTRNYQFQSCRDEVREPKEYGFIVTPALVANFNHLYHLLEPINAVFPSDTCKRDGGIACSNLSVLGNDQDVEGRKLGSFPLNRPPKSESDYLAGRILDMLDKPVTNGDHDMTVNVRDEFAANIRTLNLLFEERYKVCQDQGDRLREELSSVKQRVAVSRAATAEVGASRAGNQTIQRLKEQIVQYETKLRLLRERTNELETMNEMSIRRNQDEVEALMRRLGRSGVDEYSEQFMTALETLVDNLEFERDQVVHATRQIDRITEEQSEGFKRLVGDTTVLPSQENRLLDLEKRLRDESDKEVNSRMAATESELRVRLETEVGSRYEAMRGRFDKEVAARLSQALGGGAVPVVTIDQAQGLLQASHQHEMPQDDSDLYTDLKKYKQLLDSILMLDKSVLSVVPVKPKYAIPKEKSADNELVQGFYNCLVWILKNMRDLYTFLTIQTDYLRGLGVAASKDYVPLEYMTRKRTETFTAQVNKMLSEHSNTGGSQGNKVLKLLRHVLAELSKLKQVFEAFYRDRTFYQANEKLLQEKDAEIARLSDETQKMIEKLYSYDGSYKPKDDNELITLRRESRSNRTFIEDLKSKIAEISNQLRPSQSYPEKVYNSSGRFESLSSSFNKDVRGVFNELAEYALKLGANYKKYVRDPPSHSSPTPEMVQDYAKHLVGLFKKADDVIKYGQSPGHRIDPHHDPVAHILKLY